MKDRIIFESDIKHRGECTACGNATFSLLKLPSEVEGEPTEYKLCDKCMLSLCEQLFEKRSDLFDEILRRETGVTVSEASSNFREILDLRETIAEYKMEIEELQDKLDEEYNLKYNADEDDDDE